MVILKNQNNITNDADAIGLLKKTDIETILKKGGIFKYLILNGQVGDAKLIR